MDEQRIDDLARQFAAGFSRRRVIAGLFAGIMAPLVGRPAGVEAAACKKTGKTCDKNSDCCGHAECPGNKCRCKPGFKDCNRKCYNLDTDEKHCGKCEHKCGSGQHCCDGDCVDRDTDPDHCGACGNVCSVSEMCFGGDCIVLSGGCTPGSDLCTGVGTALCPDNPDCTCSTTTEGATVCGQPLFDAVCGECSTSADCADRGLDAFCVKSVLPCCGPDAQNVCRLPCRFEPPPG